ncbi:MAG: hypothetical protein LBR33_03780 [Propionibacteriaceae bacterium]|jgi:hypothetical protein|nr:hypothetical protein [Propionibacteriaceae bacterium]
MPVSVAIGAALFTVALVLYCITVGGVIVKGRTTPRTGLLQALAILFDAGGTICMVVYTGTPKPSGPFGYVGYLAWLLMVVELVLLLHSRAGGSGRVPAGTPLRVASAAIMALWLVVYFWGFAQ